MEKHGGQTTEGPEDILVCIVDDSYGKASHLDEEAKYQFFKKELEEEFSQEFEEVDVAPGYSVPAFATFVQVVVDHWPYIVATFFLARPISENLDVWLKAASSIKRYLVRPDVVLGRNAAAALAIEAIFEDMGGIPKTVECVRYYWRDRRFTDEELGVDEQEKMQDGPRTEYLSMALHNFEISADGVQYEVEVDGKTVNLKRK